jgi:hypothetical protein
VHGGLETQHVLALGVGLDLEPPEGDPEPGEPIPWLLDHGLLRRMVAGGLGAGKDVKLYPRGGRAWDWAETGTRHSPGIQPADVEELVAHGAATIVLSQGMNRRLQVHPDTYRYWNGVRSRCTWPRPAKR